MVQKWVAVLNGQTVKDGPKIIQGTKVGSETAKLQSHYSTVYRNLHGVCKHGVKPAQCQDCPKKADLAGKSPVPPLAYRCTKPGCKKGPNGVPWEVPLGLSEYQAKEVNATSVAGG